MTHIQAPAPIPAQDRLVFLAGSIEMGKAERWQERAIRLFEGTPNTTILNPRRDDWDSSWSQDMGCDKFVEQVKWEQDGLNWADYVLFYFDKDTMSPITLLELGLVVALDPYKAVVVCPTGFWRKGNVDVMCDYYAIEQVATLEEAVQAIRDRLGR